MPGLRRKARNSGAACALTDFQREISRTLTGANRITVVQQADLYLDTQQNLEKARGRTKARSFAGSRNRGRADAPYRSTKYGSRTSQDGFLPKE